MTPTFTTDGTVKTLTDTNNNVYFMVGRKGYKNPIRLSHWSESWLVAGVRVKVDRWGGVWIKD